MPIVGRRHNVVADTVGQHALQDETELRDEQWLGSEDEELNSYVFFQTDDRVLIYLCTDTCLNCRISIPSS